MLDLQNLFVDLKVETLITGFSYALKMSELEWQIFLWYHWRIIIFCQVTNVSSHNCITRQTGELICSRRQIPIMLCYWCTVNKSQGLTLDSVKVHAQDMFYTLLLPLAISRVRTSRGLRVTPFRRSNVIMPHQKLIPVQAVANHG